MTAGFDIAVVGSGPAGTTAARHLADAGRSVVLLERAPLPRYKVCGGGLVGRAWAALPDSARSSTIHRCHSAAMGVPALGREFVCTRERPIVSMVMRAELDQALAEAAVKAGTVLRDHCPVTGLASHPDHVELATPQGPVRASMVIAADGVNSRIARWAGWEPNPHAVPAVEWEITVDNATFDRLAGTARFDMVIPGGYGWVFPKRAGRLSVGAMTIFRTRMDLHGHVARYLADLGIRPLGPVDRHGHTIPIAPRSDRLADGRVLLVGDAAGLADPVTGEGISLSLESGALAARAVVEGHPDPASVARHYHSRLGAALLPELHAARRFAALYYRYPAVMAVGFRLWGQTICEQVTEVMAGRRRYDQIKWDIVPAMVGLNRFRHR